MDEQQRCVQIELAASGDADALQRIIVEYHESLAAAVRRGIGDALRRYIEPEDVLQEAYAAAFEAAKGNTFAGPAAFYKWLETITLHELSNQRRALRAKKRDVARELHNSSAGSTTYPDLVKGLVGSDGTPSRHMAKGEAAAAVLSSLARLSDDQRNAVRLRFIEGRPVSEVAERLGKTEGAVHGLCGRGLRALRVSLVSISRFLTRT